jgi:hypothetical protein
MADYVYDCEITVNHFLLCAVHTDTGERTSFEISARRNDCDTLLQWMSLLSQNGGRMVGFNNLGFDYVLLHSITHGMRDPAQLFDLAQRVIGSENKFDFYIRPTERMVPQIDLYKIHHFDNKARTTSLKALEFAMQLPNIADLPFPPGAHLTTEQMDVVIDYCWNDVEATVEFYRESREQVAFREQLASRYPGWDWLNFSDVKIGKVIFQIKLEEVGVQCYDKEGPRQTQRSKIDLVECVPPYVCFADPEFQRIYQHLRSTTITQTKGAFDNLSARVGGLDFIFGTGGLHASVENESFKADDEWMIYDVDVTSLYPSLAIENGYYPEHLTEKFVEVYRGLREERLKHKKGSAENAMLKLALNGVYGASNDPYSPFFDPLFTMRVTISGQLSLAMLAEWLLGVPRLKIIQCNTDGITLWMPRTSKHIADNVCRYWERVTKLSLEYVEFDYMVIADVNSYLARKLDGTVKRKGRYEYDLEWHKDPSAIVVQKVAEKVLLEGAPVMETLQNWSDFFDFMLRLRATGNTKLVLDTGSQDEPLDKTVRYYVSTEGGGLFKIMPPLAKEPDKWRRIGVQSGWKVTPCNDLREFNPLPPIDYRWYANEVSKLVDGVM